MTRTRKLAPVVDHVEKLEQDALKAVAFSQQRLQQQQQRLEQLMAYREEYANRHAEGPVSYGAVQLREFQRFMAQLDETIEQQREVVRLAEREVEFKRQKWKLTRTRSDAMHKMLDRISEQERKQLQQQEQKAMDEHALRQSGKLTGEG
jgi:flagellar FliJ protein